MSTGSRVGKCVMVIGEIKAAKGCYGSELVVGKLRQKAPRGFAGTKETIVRVGHSVRGKDGFQTAFVKGTVVRDERQIADARLDERPDVRKKIRAVRILRSQPVDAYVPMRIKVRCRVNKPIELIDDFVFSNDHDSDAAYA